MKVLPLNSGLVPIRTTLVLKPPILLSSITISLELLINKPNLPCTPFSDPMVLPEITEPYCAPTAIILGSLRVEKILLLIT